jgi:hypothetical protein
MAVAGEQRSDPDVHRELGKIAAQLEEVLRRLDRHSENEEKVDVKMSTNKAQMEGSFKEINNRMSAIESRFNYGIGALAAAFFIFEVAIKFIKVI